MSESQEQLEKADTYRAFTSDFRLTVEPQVISFSMSTLRTYVVQNLC